MDRNRDAERGDRLHHHNPRDRYEGRDRGESLDRDRWPEREEAWERDRYGRGGGYGQGSAGGYNEQQTSGYRSGYSGEDRWRGGREFGDRPGRNEWDREDRWTASQYDRGGWGSGNPSQTWGGGTRSSGAGYEDGYDRGGREYGRGSWDEPTRSGHRQGRYEREPWNRDRDWNEDTRDRDQGESHGIMESIGRFFGFGPKNYRRSDERITEEINDRLYRHPDIDASDIVVVVKEADVTLSGTVDSRRAKYLAEDLCDQVMGVKDVNNQLRVRKLASAFDRGMGGSSLGTSMGTTTPGTTTFGQSQTGTTRDVTDTTRSRNK
jgi:hypothetical protein